MGSSPVWRPIVLLVDDDTRFCADLAARLEAVFQFEFAHDGRAGIERARAFQPDAVLLDVDLRSTPDGFDVLEAIRSWDDPPPVVMLTGDERTATVVRAIRGGAWDYVRKGGPDEDLAATVRRCLLETGNRRLIEAQRAELRRMWGGFQAADPRTLHLLREIDRLAPTDATVMISGESGVGKEMVARRIHERSHRAAGPFVAVNCGAIPHELIESELFGHVRGAFTSAETDRMGLFKAASGGTLFLDEIGHAPRSLQVKLLRVIEDRVIVPVGSEKEHRLDIRILSATSQDLERSVAEESFLPELYYRLNVVRLHVPPLRDRRADILPLARHFLQRSSLNVRREIAGFSPEAEQALLEQRWPGNVRELSNTIERVALVCRGERVERDDLFVDSDPRLLSLPDYETAKDAAVREFKLRYLTSQLRHADGDVKLAAERSGMLRQSFERMCKQESIDPQRFRPAGKRAPG